MEMAQQEKGVAHVLQTFAATYQVVPFAILWQTLIKIMFPEVVVSFHFIKVEVDAIYDGFGVHCIAEPSIS